MSKIITSFGSTCNRQLYTYSGAWGTAYNSRGPSKMKCVNWKIMCELRSGLIEAGMKLQKTSSRLLSFAHIFSLRNPPGGEILKKSKFASEKASRMLRTPEFLRKMDRRYWSNQKHKNTNSVHSNCALSTQIVHKIHKSVRTQIPMESVCYQHPELNNFVKLVGFFVCSLHTYEELSLLT